MQLKGSKTEEKLRKAYSRELHVRANYKYYATAAKEAGQEQIADIFDAISENEAEHARHEFDLLNSAGNIKTNLQSAIESEHLEATELYPEAAKVAEEEGFAEVADFFRRMAKVEAAHEKNYRELLDTIGQGVSFKARTVGSSAVEMSQLMLPHQANPGGFVHGGELMKLMDNAAGVAAARHSRSNVVTAMVRAMEFHTPVRVGDLVIVRAKLTFTGRSSMEVQVRVEAEDIVTGKRRDALIAYFVMTAVDAQGKSLQVLPLVVSTEEEEKLFNEGLANYQARKAHLAK